MKTKTRLALRFILKGLGVLLIASAVFAGFLIWKNTGGEPDTGEILARLPEKVNPRYGTDPVKEWWKQTSVYQIYPRSFQDSDGDGIGDINGIISRLDYLDSLGVETLWLSPFFSSPLKDHGYDISDYRGVAPEYGDQNTVDSLIQEVHKRDMKIVFDLVLNHTSDEHPWFKESRSSRDNPKSDWYVWRDGEGDAPPNNWKNVAGQGSGWTYEPKRDQWYYAAFLPFQPDLNMSNPEVRKEMFRTVRYWLDRGVDGFRLDIFNFIFEHPSFEDNPFSWRLLPNWEEGKWAMEEHKYNFHQPEVMDFARELRAILEEYPDGRFMVGEVFGSHYQMRELLGMEQLDGLNLVFLFDFIHHFDFSAEYFRRKGQEYEAIYPAPLVPTYVFSNHDQYRSITRLDDDPRKAEVLAAYQLTMRGVPFIYQGEEIGMTTGDIPLDQAQDPLAAGWLKYPKWLEDVSGVLTNRDNCRTPMQWNSTPSAGFSRSGSTWLPVQDNYREINVANQWEEETSLLSHFRSLLHLRNNYDFLKTAPVEFLDASALPSGVLGYERNSEDTQIVVLLNFAEEPITIDSADYPTWKMLHGRRSEIVPDGVELGPLGIIVLTPEW